MTDWVPPADAQRYIVAAACKLENGLVIVGPRHMDQTMQKIKEAIGLSWWHSADAQGFVDQWGRFVDRQTAWKIAVHAGQIRRRCGGDAANGGTLYSENLY